MSNREINKKKIAIEVLKELDTGTWQKGEILETLKLEVAAYEDTIKANQEEVIDDFTGVYLRNDYTHLTETIEFYKIDEIIVGDRDIEYNQLYNLKGEKLTFSRLHAGSHTKNLDSTTESSLRSMKVIDKETFEKYLNESKKIKKLIDNVLDTFEYD